MAGDFRVALDFLDHPKTVRLKSLVGAEGVFCLMRLWAFAGNYRPRGLLTGMNPQDIAIAAKWTENSDLFVTALLDSKFLDKLKNGVYRLHNWKLRQGYLYHKPERQERARKGGKARQAKVDNDLRSAKNTNKHTPSPSPSPTPTPNTDSHARASSPHDRLQSWVKSEEGKTWIQEQIKIYGKDLVGHEYVKARQWVKDNPKRGNKRNWKRFLSTWFGRAEESQKRQPKEDVHSGLPTH